MMDDRAIEALLRSGEPEFDDAFPARVMARVQRRDRVRRWLPVAAAMLGLVVAAEPIATTAGWVSSNLMEAPARIRAMMK